MLRPSQAITDSEERLRLCVEQSPVCTMMLDREMNHLVVNKHWLETYCPNEASLIGRNHYEVFPRAAMWREAHQRGLAGGKEKGAGEFIRKDGRHVHVEWEIQPWFDRDGSVGGIVIYSEDVTEKKRAEIALRKRGASLAAAQELAHMGSWELELKTGEGTWSTEMAKLHYYDLTAWAPPFESFLALVHPQDRAEFACLHRRIMEKDTPTVHEYRTNPDRGPIRYLRATVKLQHSAQGEAEKLIGTTQDITLLRRSEARIRRLINSNAQGVYFWRINGEIFHANNAFLKMLGYTREELEKGELTWRMIAPPEYEKLDLRLLKDLQERGYCGPVEKEYIHRDGRRVPVLIGADSFCDELGDQEMLEGVCFALDLTDRKKLEQQLLRSQRMEGIGTLAGGIAHDLNNILTPILLSISMLKHTVNAEDKEILNTIETSAKRGADIVRQVLSFARGVPGVRVEVKAGPIIKELSALMKDTFPKNILQSFSLASPLWTFYGDPTQVHQLLLNLCLNARDAMPAGGQLNVSLENCLLGDGPLPEACPPLHPGQYVLIKVEDTGVGMSPEVIDKIFEPFFTTKPLNKGTGLGLSTVMAIVKTHQASIQVNSQLGRGSSFVVYLPAVLEEASPEVNGVPQTTTFNGRGKTVLVVDDEPAILSITKRVLTNAGYSVLTATNGREALTLFKEYSESITVILTDSMMPVLDGHCFIETIKIVSPAINIILMSGLTNEQSPGHFLRKPFTAESLLEAIKAACQ
jgi:PAS domain S-box-containing protein